MKRISIGITCLSALALTACGSSNTGSRSENPTGKVFAEAVGETFSKKLDEGETFTGQDGMVTSVEVDYDARTSTKTAAHSAKIRLPNAGETGELAMEIDGVTRVFTTADREPSSDGKTYGYHVRDAVTNERDFLFAWSGGELDEVLSGDPNSNYHQVWHYGSSKDDGTGAFIDKKGYLVVGSETPKGGLPAGSVIAPNPMASYGGYANFYIISKDGADPYTENRLESRDVQMTADFGAGTIAGTMSDMRFRDDDENWSDLNGSIAMGETAITGTGFAGNLTADGDLMAAAPVTLGAGSFTGQFFGPTGENVAGTLEMGVTDGGVARNTYGFFNAGK